MTRNKVLALGAIALGAAVVFTLSIATSSTTSLIIDIAVALVFLGLAGLIFLSKTFQLKLTRLFSRGSQAATKRYFAANEDRLASLIAEKTVADLNTKIEDSVQVVVKRHMNRVIAEELRNREVLNKGLADLQKAIRIEKQEAAAETVKVVDARMKRFMSQLERELVQPLEASELARVEVKRLIEGLAQALEELQTVDESPAKAKASAKGK